MPTKQVAAYIKAREAVWRDRVNALRIEWLREEIARLRAEQRRRAARRRPAGR
jgi:hypothetical protein